MFSQKSVRCLRARQSLDGGVPIQMVMAIFCAFLVSLSVWPGLMSWDSLFAYKQMIDGITSSAYPPVMSYVWLITDQLISGPGGMLILQNLLIFCSVGTILYCLNVGTIAAAAALGILLFSAVIVGPMLVIWKDIGMSAFLIASVAMMVLAVTSHRRALLLVAFLFMAVGAGYRLNSLPAIAPLAFALVLCYLNIKSKSFKLIRAAIGSSIVFMLIALIAFLSLSYRLPDFKKLPLGFNAGWVAAYDLLGMSACLGENLLPAPFFAEPMSIETLRAIYHPEHVQLSFDMSSGGNPKLLQTEGLQAAADELPTIWSDAIKSYPGCYIIHRVELLKFMLGLNQGSVFYITHGGIDPNEYGIQIQFTPLTHRVLGYMNSSAQPGIALKNLLARGWFLMILACISLTVLLVRQSQYFLFGALLFASAILYLAGNVFVLPAGDARYQHWALLCFLVVSFLSIAEWQNRAISQTKNLKDGSALL